MNLTKVIVPAAGRGTRLLPATKIVSKELIPIIDRPTVDYAVEEIAASGFQKVVFITTDAAGEIKKYFLEDQGLVSYLKEKKKDDCLNLLPCYPLSFDSVQQREASGLGAAILTAEKKIGNEFFAVTLVDDIIDAKTPVLQQMRKVFEQKKASIIAVMDVTDSEVPAFGIVEGDEVSPNIYKIKRLVEKPRTSETSSRLAIIGRYILSPKLFSCLKKTQPGKGGEIQLTDGLSLLLQSEEMYAYKFDGKRIDAGDKLGLLKANLYFGAKNKQWYQELKSFFESGTFSSF